MAVFSQKSNMWNAFVPEAHVVQIDFKQYENVSSIDGLE